MINLHKIMKSKNSTKSITLYIIFQLNHTIFTINPSKLKNSSNSQQLN